MTSLAALATKVSGNQIALSDWQQIKANSDWLVVAGANLASATTLNPTAEFHIVTGTTTVDTLTLSGLTVVNGQQVRLLFQSALTVRNNGGGTGNIRTLAGVDKTVQANEIVTFVYDGTNWREQGRGDVELVYAESTSTVTINSTSEGAISIISAGAYTFDGVTPIAVEYFCPYVQSSTTGAAICYFSVYEDATQKARAAVIGDAANAGGGALLLRYRYTPASGSKTISIKSHHSAGQDYSAQAGASGAATMAPMWIRLSKAKG